MILYHATYNLYLPYILREGLGGVEHKNWDFSTGDVCLASDPYNAESYAETAPEFDEHGDEMGVPAEAWKSGIAILAVDVDGLELRIDPNIYSAEEVSCFVFSGVIAPERLSVIKI